MFNVPEFTIEAGKATGEIVMPLLRGYAVRGQVVDASTGAGIAEAGIGFRVPADRYGGYGGPRSAPWAKSKDDGSFVLDGIPGGDIVLTGGHRTPFGQIFKSFGPNGVGTRPSLLPPRAGNIGAGTFVARHVSFHSLQIFT